jgi:hypothetical protein
MGTETGELGTVRAARVHQQRDARLRDGGAERGARRERVRGGLQARPGAGKGQRDGAEPAGDRRRLAGEANEDRHGKIRHPRMSRIIQGISSPVGEDRVTTQFPFF